MPSQDKVNCTKWLSTHVNSFHDCKLLSILTLSNAVSYSSVDNYCDVMMCDLNSDGAVLTDSATTLYASGRNYTPFLKKNKGIVKPFKMSIL